MEQINEAFVLLESFRNDTSVSDHVASSIETFLATPLTPLARRWDNFAGDYLSNAVGNGMFYAILLWSAIYNLYAKFMNIALRGSPWSNAQSFQLADAIWYVVVHSILFTSSLWMVDPGYVGDILHLDVWSFSWRMLMHSVRVVPRNVMFVFVACSTFQIFSAIHDIMLDKNKSASRRTFAAISFVIMYCLRKMQLLLMANASLCVYGAICEALHIYHIMTVPTTLRTKITRLPVRKVTKRFSAEPIKKITEKYSSHLTDNKAHMQTLYDTVKGALILKRSIKRHQERRKQAQMPAEQVVTDISDAALSDSILSEITNQSPIVEFPDDSSCDDKSSP